jgi:hypothetical protein
MTADMSQAEICRYYLGQGKWLGDIMEMIEIGMGRWKGDGYLPAPGEHYDPDPFGVGLMSEEEYLAFLETQPALPEYEEALPTETEKVTIPVGVGNRS